MKRFAAFVTGVSLLAAQAGFAQMGAPGERPVALSAVPGPLAAKYKADADKILAAAMADNDGYAFERRVRLTLRAQGGAAVARVDENE